MVDLQAPKIVYIKNDIKHDKAMKIHFVTSDHLFLSKFGIYP